MLFVLADRRFSDSLFTPFTEENFTRETQYNIKEMILKIAWKNYALMTHFKCEEERYSDGFMSGSTPTNICICKFS